MKTILEHARMLSRDRLSLGFNDTFPEMIEKLREELKELEEVPGSADPSYELADCLLVLARMFELLKSGGGKDAESSETLRPGAYSPGVLPGKDSRTALPDGQGNPEK